ncbi:MAG: type II toxin-antitoxin system RelE/ParE family toxin [Chitinophagaceae bacterium]
MVCRIVWTAAAIESYITNIEYLEKAWSEKEVKRFKLLTEKKVALLAQHPELGTIKAINHKNTSPESIRCSLVHKKVMLVYRFCHERYEIELLWFWNTRMSPPLF